MTSINQPALSFLQSSLSFFILLLEYHIIILILNNSFLKPRNTTQMLTVEVTRPL